MGKISGYCSIPQTDDEDKSDPDLKACQRSFCYFYISFYFSILDFFIGEIWGILMETFEVFYWRDLRCFDGGF